MSALLFHLGLGSLGLLAAALLTALALRLLRGRPAGAYVLAAAVLGAAVCLPLGQWALEGRAPGARELAAIWPRTTAGATHAITTPSDEPEALSAAESPVFGDPEPVDADHLRRLLAAAALADKPAPAVSEPVPIAPATPSPWRRPAPWLVGLYLLGLGLSLLGTVRRLLGTRALLREAAPLEHAQVLASWRRVSADSPLAQRVRLLTSEQVRTPVCFGWRHPVVVVPATAPPELDAEALACVLLHELVHLERRDTWVMLVQELFRALFWFHPAAWWLSRRLDGLRELSCDWWVVRRLGGRGRYARALVEFAARMGEAETRSPLNALLPWFGGESQLSRRIEMLVTRPIEVTGPRRFVPYATAGLLFASLWGGQLATAASLRLDPAAQESRPEPLAPWVVEPTVPAPPVTEPVPAAVALPELRWGVQGLRTPPAAPVAPEPSELAFGVARRPAPPAHAARRGVARGGPGQNTDSFGIRLSTVDEVVGRVLTEHLGLAHGAVLIVTGVNQGSFAERVGLQPDDLILGINGQPATVPALHAARAPGPDGADPWVSFDVLRKGDRRVVEGRFQASSLRSREPADPSDSHDSYVERAHALLKEGRSAEAEQLLQQALRTVPRAPGLGALRALGYVSDSPEERIERQAEADFPRRLVEVLPTGRYPVRSSGEALYATRGSEPIVVRVTPEGEIVHEGRRVETTRVGELVRAELRLDERRPLIVQFDAQASPGLLVEIIDQSKAAGAQEVSVARTAPGRSTDEAVRRADLESELSRTRRELRERSVELEALRRRLDELEARSAPRAQAPRADSGESLRR